MNTVSSGWKWIDIISLDTLLVYTILKPKLSFSQTSSLPAASLSTDAGIANIAGSSSHCCLILTINVAKNIENIKSVCKIFLLTNK